MADDPLRDPARRRPGAPAGPRRRNPLRSPGLVAWFLAIIAVNVIVTTLLSQQSATPRVTIAYSTFKDQVATGNVTEITATGDQITGHVKKAVTALDGTQTASDFTTTRPAYDDPGLEALLEAHSVQVVAQPPSDSLLGTLLLSFGPALLLVGFFVWMMRRSPAMGGGQSGLFGLGRSSARLYVPETKGVTFADVAGVEEAKEELREVVDFLREPQKYERLGGTMPKGVLLVGAPGTGKTLLARAVAGEAGVPFFSVSASEFVEMIVGVGAARVRDLFTKARAAAPAIVFVDELDAVGRSRAAAVRIGGHDEQEQTLNQILTEMDGFDSREGVIVLAATNRPDVLDIALLRPGRFDRHVTLEPPDRAGRQAILAIHARNVPLDPAASLERVASMTTGMVGADLHNLVNEAALSAARRGRPAVTADDFDEAFEKVLLGAARHIVMTADDRRRTAYHEAGHALVSLLLPDADPVRKVSIVPRGRALGATVQSPVDDRQNYPETYLRTRITSALGGRAAEQIVYGVVTTGAENDLRLVTHVAHEMVVRFGMSARVGLVQYDGDAYGAEAVAVQARPYSEETARVIDAEVKRIVDECFDHACALLRANRERLDALTEALLADEHLEEEEIRRAVSLPAPPAAPETSAPLGSARPPEPRAQAAAPAMPPAVDGGAAPPTEAAAAGSR